MRLLVYSHDAFGLGNIRRMLTICQHLLDNVFGLSILLVSGSPVVHSLRLPPGLDYIKLPCLGRDRSGKLTAKYLGTGVDETVKLRSDIIKTAIANFQPDLLLVDKKPYGLKGELKESLDILKTQFPETKLVLLLRDILDSPEATIKDWQTQGYYQAIDQSYDRVLTVGMPEIFDPIEEYQLPASLSHKVKFCGYIRRETGRKSRSLLRQELQTSPDEPLVLVTPGGGGDGYHLVNNYICGVSQLSPRRIKSLIVCGPEMPPPQRQKLYQAARQHSQVQIGEFTDDMTSYMEAADAIVSMGGYNTVCEILSLNKRAVVVPRVQPVQEQWIRAKRMANLGLFKVIHPDFLTPQKLVDAVLEQLRSRNLPLLCLDLNALPRIEQEVLRLVFEPVSGERIGRLGGGTQPLPLMTFQ